MLFGTHPRTRDTWGVRHISRACCWQQANYMHLKFWRHLGVGAANLLHAALSTIWRIVQIEVEQHNESPHSTRTFVWHWYACSHTKCSCHTKMLHLTTGHFFPVLESEAKHLPVKYSAHVAQIYAKLVNVSMTAVSEWAWQLSEWADATVNDWRYHKAQTLQFAFTVKQRQSTLHQSRRTFNVHRRCLKNAQFAYSSQLVTPHSSSYASETCTAVK